MCGIAGIMDLKSGRTPPEGVIERMAAAILHRGPDEVGYFRTQGLHMVNQRLSIVGLADGQQPMHNEDGSLSVVFNGELFDYVEKRSQLKDRGHSFHTHCDTEIIPHMWEEYGDQMWDKLRGQFAIALWDERKQTLRIGRDRFGISPLYWTRVDDWFLFGSEIKALLASGMVPREADLRGIDQVFTFAAMPGPVTCFKNVQMLRPAHCMQITPSTSRASASLEVKPYWEMDFPDAGDERDGDAKTLVNEFEQLMLQAVEKRLRADVPVGAYLSGGVDSSTIVALACKLKGPAINTYTVRVDHPDLDELDAASLVARRIGAKPPVVQNFRTEDAINSYPRLIEAAECPVIDTSCAALLQLSQRVHTNGQKVVLTGEGADEWLIGYPWYKAAKLLGYLDAVPGLHLGEKARRMFLRMNKVPQYPPEFRHGIERALGGSNAWIDSYGLLGLAKLRLYSSGMMPMAGATQAWTDLGMNVERAKKWHPLNRGVWVAARVTLAGHLLQAKGDRVAMHNSVEARYPFLDEEVFNFTAHLHPKWKLHGFRDKHLLRLMAARWVPKEVYGRGKVIFRAPLDCFHLDPAPAFVTELLSEESLRKTGYFDPAAVAHWRRAYSSLKAGSLPRLSIEMGLAAVVATQLWHHKFIDSSLASL